MKLLNRFLNYVKIDTQSNEESETTPSSTNQLNLLNLICKELSELGVDFEMDEYSRVYAHIPGNPKLDSIGVCAHVDTASECSGKNVKPQVITNYDLSDIPLGSSGLFLSPKEYKKLYELKGKTIISTDGTTLLGGDDKAGVAIIMEAVSQLVKKPQNSHHPVSILFTPDEEIGRGADYFNKDKFNAKYAYTIDGDDPKYISIENFNAKSVNVEIIGKSIHPGDAKGVMINAILVLAHFMNLLPKNEIPAKTSGKEGFNHVTNISGEVEYASANYILRNHDQNKLNKQVDDFLKAKEDTLKEFPGASINLTFKDQYKNMYEVISKNDECKKHIEEVYKHLNLPFNYEPIRGGTDGATFSFKGVACPNLGTGSYNHHGRYEFAVVEEMELLVNIVKTIFEI